MKRTFLKFINKWGAVFVLSLALAIILIDTTLLNVSLETLAKDFNTDIQSLQWIITAYSLTVAALTITGGRLGDLFGRKRMFIIGAMLFAIGSFVASISNNVATMIVGEAIIEGVGAALMMPATASLLVSKYHGKDRALAFGVWGGVAGAATAIGPMLGGYMTTYTSWRWGFRINIIVVALLLLGSVWLKDYHDKSEKTELDFGGVALSASGMLLVVYGIIEASTYGWWSPKTDHAILGLSITPWCIALGLIVLFAFMKWEQTVEARGDTPLVSLRLLKIKPYMAGVMTTMIFALSQAGLVFSIPLFLQSVRGASAFDTGLALLPTSIGSLIAAPLSGFFARKIAPKRLVQFGLALFIISFLYIYIILTPSSTAQDLAIPFAIMGVGVGIMMSSINNLTLSSVSIQQAGEASGVNNTMRQVGATMGTAIIGSIVLSSITTNLTTNINQSTVFPSAAKTAIAKQLTSHIETIELGDQSSDRQLPPSIKTEVERVVKQSITDSNRTALLYAVIFGGLGMIMTTFLPGGVKLERAKSAMSHKS